MKLKRGNIVQMVFPGEPIIDRKYKVSAVSPDNHLCNDRADICEVNDTKSFRAKRGIGVLIKYLRKVSND